MFDAQKIIGLRISLATSCAEIFVFGNVLSLSSDLRAALVGV
jgi:hypothetical protein